jgi:transposase
VIGRFGHTVRLIAPHFVKPYVKSNKNDSNDPEGICEAVSRPQMRFVPAKSVEQQDIQSLQRVWSRVVSSRTQLANQIRGLLTEYGIVLLQHVSQLRCGLPLILDGATNVLTAFSRRLCASLYDELLSLEERSGPSTSKSGPSIMPASPANESQRWKELAPLIATALDAALSDGKTFANGRQFAVWLGLVPRQHSSGGKARLPGISKCADSYLRTFLIHGARSVVYRASPKIDRRSLWIADKQRRSGKSKACAAVANKNGRIVWSLIAGGEVYRCAA